MNNKKDHFEEMLMIVIAMGAGTLIYGVALSVLIVGMLYGLTQVYKLDRLAFALALLCIPLGYQVLYYHTAMLDAHFVINKDWFVIPVVDFLARMGLPDNWLRPCYRYLTLSFSWSPIGAALILFILQKRFKFFSHIFKDIKRPRLSNKKICNYRNKPDQVFMGINQLSSKPSFLIESERVRHMQVLGATGFGKTESVLMPMIEHDIKTGKGLLLIDAKADSKLAGNIYQMACAHRREKNVLIFNPSLVKTSSCYNPFSEKPPTIIANQIIASLEWTEPYYKKMSQLALLIILQAMNEAGIEPDIFNLIAFLKDPFQLLKLTPKNEDLKKFCVEHKKNKTDYVGLCADLSNLASSDFGLFMITGKRRMINLKEAYKKNQIIIFQISTFQYPETAAVLGRLLLRDIMEMSGYILGKYDESQTKFFPAYIDEFGSFAMPSFADFMRMSRASGVAVTILHQTTGDLDYVSPFFKNQIMGNCNIKIILKPNDNETIEESAMMSGTKEKIVHTHQVIDQILMPHLRTGMGSEVIAEEFRIHPNKLRSLGIGEAFMMVNSTNRIEKLKLSRIQTHQNNFSLPDLYPSAPDKETIPDTKKIESERKLSKVLFDS